MAHFGRVNTSTRCMSPMPRHLPRAFGLPFFLAHTSHAPQVVRRAPPLPGADGRGGGGCCCCGDMSLTSPSI